MKRKNKPKVRYIFRISVLDTYTDKSLIDVRNLNKDEAKIVMGELLNKFD